MIWNDPVDLDALGMFPAGVHFRPRGARSNYCKAPDNHPLVGPTMIEGVYVLGALSGFGIMGSQAAAELLAAYLLNVPLPDYAAAFHPARFDDPLHRRILATLDPKGGQL